MMFRLRCVNPCLRRLLHLGAVNRDQVLEQLQICSVEDQVFDVVSNNKTKLTVEHVSCAVRMLWNFQKERPDMLRTVELTKSHPQFLTLQVLAENKITLMDDITLVDMLYDFHRVTEEPHNSLVQQMVLEAWQRIDGLPLSSLSKFAVCLTYQNLQKSPLMGRITSILDQKLSAIDDTRVLIPLMSSVSYLVSPRLRDALIVRAKQLLGTTSPSSYKVLLPVLKFMLNQRYMDLTLLETCNENFLRNISSMNVFDIRAILIVYDGLRFKNHDFRLAAKKRLIELMDTSTDPQSFSVLFDALAPMASMEVRERLESTTLLLADEFNAPQTLVIIVALEKIQSRNLSLLNKIVSVIQKRLHVYSSVKLTKIFWSLFRLKYHNAEFFATLRKVLLSFLQSSFYPSKVAKLTKVLSMLPPPLPEEDVFLRVDEVIAQCNLSDLNAISFAISKWVQNDPLRQQKTHSKYSRLMQKISQCGCERLQTADQLDLVLDELRDISEGWFKDRLYVDTITTLSRMIDQINWNNVPELAFFLHRLKYRHRPLLDRIASVAVEHIDKIHFPATRAILLPFSAMNYEPEQADELYNAVINRFTPHMSSYDPHLLVLLARTLVGAGRFPEELVREIFSIDFLEKLESELEFNMRMRLQFMELNRILCLECPEFQVPWFHEQYCQQLTNKGKRTVNLAKQEIHKMLGEVLGGNNFVKVAVVTPYYYTVDFECKLDKNLQPLRYSEPSSLQISSQGMVFWPTGSPKDDRDDLPPGAQRIVVDFLDPRFFCKNSYHMTSNASIRKRHLEIMGYRVVQIPHFEWNYLKRSKHDSQKDYLQQKILG